MEGRAPRMTTLLALIALLVVAGVVVYGQVVGFSFVTLDDTNLIVRNPHVHHWWSAPLRARLLTYEFHYAMPVTLASFALDWKLYSGRAAGFHLTNLLLHLACAALLLRVLSREVRLSAAVFGAALFLLHPVQAESVAFVTQRKDLLVGLFALLAVERLQARAELRARDVTWIVTCAALSALSKPTGALLPAALAAGFVTLRGWPKRPPERALVVALFFVSVIVVLLDLHVARTVGQVIDLGPMSFARRLGLVASSLVHYLRSLAVPLDLAPRVIPPEAVSVATFVVAGATLLVVLAATGFAVRRRARAALPLLFLCAAYLPSANLIPIARYVADGYLYAPMAAIAWCVALAADATLERAPRIVAPIAAAAAVLLALTLGALSTAQAAVWRDEERLFGYVYALLPLSPEAFAEYVDRLERNGKRAAANEVRVAYFTRALERWPASLGARQGLARAHLARGDAAAALRVVAETPAELRNGREHLELTFEIATLAKRWDLALAAARALVAMVPEHPLGGRIAELEALAR